MLLFPPTHVRTAPPWSAPPSARDRVKVLKEVQAAAGAERRFSKLPKSFTGEYGAKARVAQR
jgi:hypothetical protein